MVLAPVNYYSNVWKIYAFELLKGLSFFGAVLIPFFTEWGKLNFEQIFFLQAWFMFWIFVLEVPTGAFADRFGRKNSLILGAFINVFGALLYVYEPRFEFFLIAEFLWAMSSAFYSGADEAILYDSLKETKTEHTSKKVFSNQESIHLVGIMVSAPIGGWAAYTFGITTPYFLAAASFALAFIVALTLKEPPIHSPKQKPDYFRTIREGIGYLRTHHVLKVLAADMVIIATIGYFMIWLFQPLLTLNKIPILWFGFVQAALVAAEIALLQLYPYIEKKLGSKKRLLFGTSLATGIMFILAGVSTFIPLMILAIILGGAIGLTRKPLMSSYMQKYIPSEKRATIMSGVNMLRTLAIVIANLIVGKLAGWNVPNTFIILGIIAIVAAFISKVEERHLVD